MVTFTINNGLTSPIDFVEKSHYPELRRIDLATTIVGNSEWWLGATDEQITTIAQAISVLLAPPEVVEKAYDACGLITDLDKYFAMDAGKQDTWIASNTATLASLSEKYQDPVELLCSLIPENNYPGQVEEIVRRYFVADTTFTSRKDKQCLLIK